MKTIRQIDKEIKRTLRGETKENLDEKEKKSSRTRIVIGSLILVCIAVVFVIPFTYEKYTLYTDMAKVQYNAQESYQETVNYDGCDSSSSCVCTVKGGLLWLTCKQCSCTRQREVVREKVISVLKEKTETNSATLFSEWTNSRISQNDAIQTTQTLLNFLSQKGYGSGVITATSKEDGNWVISIGTIPSISNIYMDANTGKIINIAQGSNMISFDSFLRSVNSY